MKNAKLISILAIVVAAILLACGAFLGFDRGSDIGGTYVIEVDFNETFKAKDVEAIMKQAGATGCVVQTKTDLKDEAVISFEVPDDSVVLQVVQKAEELISQKYYLAFPSTFDYFSSTFNKKAAIDMWPVLIVFVALLAYAFIRFGVKMGFIFIADMFIPAAATAGLISLTGLKVTNFTIPSLLFTIALAFMFTFIFAMLKKEGSFDLAAKQVSKIALVVSAIVVIAFAVLLIFASSMLMNFAITTLVGVVLNLATIIYVLPGLANDNKKA